MGTAAALGGRIHCVGLRALEMQRVRALRATLACRVGHRAARTSTLRWGCASQLLAARSTRAKATDTAAAEASEESSSSSSGWRSLGLGEELASSLAGSGFHSPSETQRLAIPSVVRGGDVVIAAETGSGKTIAYLAPVLQRLLSSSLKPNDDSGAPEVGLVLCPNIQLCKQVSRVAKGIAEGLGPPGARPRVVDATEDGYFEGDGPSAAAAMVVCTPSIFEKTFVTYKAGAARVDLRVTTLVLDETDMLLTGGFEPATSSILEWCQWEDRQLKIDSVLEATGMSYDDFVALPYKHKRGAYKAGLRGMAEAGWRLPARVIDPDPPFSRCQYIFAGATIPDYGTKSVQGKIQKWCPDASWVRGRGLHNPSAFKGRMEQEWREVGSMGDAYAALAEALAASSPSGGGRVIAFNKDVRHAVECAEVLRGGREGLDRAVLEFHRSVPLDERMANLEEFRRAEDAVLVCTDAASRGLDIPDVSCVVQVGFAASAVDYVHRIGRTARAGKMGRVVNVYTRESEDLVRSVREAIRGGRPVQDAFSRKRSFRKRIRKESKREGRGGGRR